MELLKKHPELSIIQVAHKYKVPVESLRDAQLNFLKTYLSRNNPLWSISGYGRQ